jgi:spore coat protein U-like protein
MTNLAFGGRPSMRNRVIATLAALGMTAAALAPTAVIAATTTTTFAVSATVASTCTVSATALAFGTYSGTVIDQTSSLSVTCSTGATYNIGLSAGTTAGATTAARLLSDGASGTLGYALFRDAGRTLNWGNTVNTDTLAGTGTGAAQAVSVYGRIAGGQTATAGTYTDTITVTVTY